MKRTVVSLTQHLGQGGNWNTEVRLDDGSEFHDMVPTFQIGDEIEVSQSGEVKITTADGKPFAFRPQWVRAPMPPVGLEGVSTEREHHLRPLAAKEYKDYRQQDAWIQGCAWNADGDKPRQSVADAFAGGPLRDAALAGWDFVEEQRRLGKR